jgi:hypothetical protein
MKKNVILIKDKSAMKPWPLKGFPGNSSPIE